MRRDKGSEEYYDFIGDSTVNYLYKDSVERL